MTHTPHAAAAVTTATWDGFVAEHGVAAAVGMLSAVLAVCWTQLEGVTTPAILVCQLLLACIALGCVAVLSYRSES